MATPSTSSPRALAHRHDRMLRLGCDRPPLCARSHVGGEDVVGVAIEVLAGPVVLHGGAWVGVAGGDLHVAEVDSGVEHLGHEGVPEHVWVHAPAAEPLPRRPGAAVAYCRVAVHSGAVSYTHLRAHETDS